MGKLGCSIDGNLNEAKFDQPMPWIGLYIAAASLACAITMAADVGRGFRQQKLWFPSKYFSINATSLTIISVAVKFSVDLNTAMPSRVDQLAKLSSSVLLCTVMGNSMPSLGTMDNNDLFMNLMALGILVVTVIVNIGIQLGTGVIYLYWKEHAFVMFLMLILLVILSFSALTVPTNKKYLEYKYNKKCEMALREGPSEGTTRADKKLKDDLMKYWMMGHTCSPQFVIGRSVTCIASGALCLLGAITLAEAMLRSYLMPWSFKFCNGQSAYKWSNILVLIAQTVAVGVGTIAPAIRWFTAVNFRCPARGKQSCKRGFKVERYWLQLLVEMKECPLTVRIQYRCCRKFAHEVKNKLLDLCIGMQTGIVLGSKVIQFISVYFVSRILLLSDFCKTRNLKLNNSIATDSGSESRSSPKPDLSRFILHLEGEDELIQLMMKKNFDATDHWLQRGKRKQPKHLIDLLEKSTIAEGFKGVKEFDSDLVPSLGHDEPPNCWSLPIATLTAIAVALPNVSSSSIKQLICGVHEGLMHVKIIEDDLDTKRDLINVRKAAHVVWLGVDLYQKWLDVDLKKISLEAESAEEILRRLADAAKNRFIHEFNKIDKNQCQRESPSKWPIKALAANSMYRITQTILQNHESRSNLMGEILFEELIVIISDILGACLTNLQRAILHCLGRASVEAESCVRNAVFLLGKTEKMLKLLDHQPISSFSPDQMVYIDEWRSLHNAKNALLSIPSPDKSSTALSTSSDLYLTIE